MEKILARGLRMMHAPASQSLLHPCSAAFRQILSRRLPRVYFKNSGRMSAGSHSGICGQMMSMASTSSIGTSMINVSLRA